jgi:hypothetical protein
MTAASDFKKTLRKNGQSIRQIAPAKSNLKKKYVIFVTHRP